MKFLEAAFCIFALLSIYLLSVKYKTGGDADNNEIINTVVGVFFGALAVIDLVIIVIVRGWP